MRPHYSYGYLKLALWTPKGRFSFRVHRLVAEAFIRPLASGEVVDHINRVRDDNRAVNLRVVDASANSANKILRIGVAIHVLDCVESGLTREQILKSLGG